MTHDIGYWPVVLRCVVLVVSLVEIGIMVTGLGLFFLVFGTIMFLDRALLAFGNVCVATCMY
jgi:hypothetical protein